MPNKTSTQAAEAFMEARAGRFGNNTRVVVEPNVTILKLFGNTIAYRYNDPENTILVELKDGTVAIGLKIEAKDLQQKD